MRILVVLAVILGFGARAWALDLRTPALSAGVPQELRLVERDFKAGESSGWHIHHGIEMAYVMQGDVRVTIERGAPRMLHAGDSFKLARDTPHEVFNVGSTEARLIISYMMDKGVEERILIAKPTYAPN